MTMVAAALLVVVALAANAGFAGERSRAAAVHSHAAARDLLDSVTSNVAKAQQALIDTSTGATPFNSGIGQVVQAEQSAVDGWGRYLALERELGPVSAASARVTADLARWVASSPAASPTTSSPPSDSNLVAGIREILRSVGADLVVVLHGDDTWLAAASQAQADDAGLSLLWVLLACVAAAAAIIIGNTLISRAGGRKEAVFAVREGNLAASVATNEFEARLQRALDLATTEPRVNAVMERALIEAVPDLGVEVLLADSSRAHFQQLMSTGDIGSRHCSVGSPIDCPAAQRGAVLTFDSSMALDACPYLQDQAEACSAVCVPVSVNGTTVGVVHAAGPHGQRASRHQLTELELIARRASDRVGMLRAFAKSETQANTDALTGLPNRRALEDAVHRLDLAGTSYAVAFGDLDRFKMLNDVHGHATGDSALRLFSRALRRALRPNDLVGRFGGEEFVIVLPGCDQAAAAEVLERIRTGLADAVAESDLPAFTVSFGLTEAHEGATFEILLGRADAALLEAKARGRNCVVAAGDSLRNTSTHNHRLRSPVEALAGGMPLGAREDGLPG